MADYTTTTNLSLKKPAIGGSSDKWGEYINSSLDDIDSAVGSLQAASTSRSLESLNNVLDATPTTGQLLQYDTATWKAATVTIPDNIQDLTNVTVTSPADGQVLAWSNSNSRWENQTPGAATIPDGTITNAKLDTSLQGQVALILQTTGTPTDDQVLQYNSTTTNWEFVDLPGGNISTLSDTDVSSVSLGNALMYNASGDWEARDIIIADVTNLQTTLDTKLESSDLSSYVTSTSLTTTLGGYVTSTTLATELADYTETSSLALGTLNNVTLTTPANNDFLVYDSVTSDWENQTPTNARTALGLGTIATQDSDDVTITGGNISGIVDLAIADGGTGASSVSAARTNLGLGALATQDTITESQISDLGSYITASSTDTLTNKSGNISMFTNDAGYLTAETNDLSNVSGTLAIANGGTGLTAIGVANQVLGVNSGATALEFQTISITESQISDLQSYLTASSTATLTNKSGNISQWTNDAGYLTAESNNLSTVSGTLGTANGGTGLTAIGTANQVLAVNSGATALEFQTISITESQISDLQTYLTAETNDLTSAVTWANVPDANITQSSVTQHQTALSITESQISDLQTYLTAASTATLTNKSGNISQWTNDAGYLTAETNNLSTVSGTLGTANGGTGLTSIGTAGQVLKVNSGATALEFADESVGGGSGSAYIEHSSTVSDSLAISSGTNRMYVGNTAFSGSGTMAGYLVISHGFANFTGASALNVTGTLRIIG